MKGTDVPQSELDNAEKFLKMTNNWEKLRTLGDQNREGIKRLIAWYGAIRSRGEIAGELVSKESQIAEGRALRGK